MNDQDWRELLRMLAGLGLRIVSTDRETLTVCVRVPEIRQTRDDSIREWS